MRTSALVGFVTACSVVLAAQSLAAQADPRARIFVERGCSACHAITGLKVKAQADVGPDLTYAAVDVTTRYAVSLERFFEEPEGAMRLVLGSHVQLSKVDRDSVAKILRRLYIERLAERPGMAPTRSP